MWLRRLIVLLPILLLPQIIFASVSISEVAWMGSSQSANYEWIELYNDGPSEVVDGWTISDGANLVITLAGTVPANTYVVLERNRNDGGSVVGTPFLNYSGALINTGSTLTLSRLDGSIVDSVAGGENWQSIGGDNTTKDTAQYTPAGWITAMATPGRANATVGTTPTPTNATTARTTSSKTVLSANSKTLTTKTKAQPEQLSLEIVAPAHIYEGQPVSWQVVPSGMTSTIRNSLKYQWNFGDLHTATATSPVHTYTYPGTYNVVVEASFASYKAFVRQEVAVLPLAVSLSHSAKGDVLLHNNAMYEIDISKYYFTATKLKQIPPQTYISPRETITIPWQMISASPFPAVVLLGREREVITSTNHTTALSVAPSVPIASSVSAVAVPAGSDVNTTASNSTTFGFAPAVAHASTEQPLDTTDNSEFVIESRGEADETSDLVPILLASNTTSTPQAPLSSTWWTYILLVIILITTITTLHLRSPK